MLLLNRRLRNDDTADNRNKFKVEHWAPQSRHLDLALDYKNLLAACPGNEGSPPQLQHCDTSKKDAFIKLDPRTPSVHSKHPAQRPDGTGR